jgi:hypothetical protein
MELGYFPCETRSAYFSLRVRKARLCDVWKQQVLLVRGSNASFTIGFGYVCGGIKVVGSHSASDHGNPYPALSVLLLAVNPQMVLLHRGGLLPEYSWLWDPAKAGN